MIKVTAAVIEREGLILLARRKKEKEGGGYLEFPGGKVLPNEDPAKGLSRELKEELGVEVKIGEFLGFFKNENIQPEIELWVYRGEMTGQPTQLSDHEEIIWVKPQEVSPQELLPLDREILSFLLSKNEK